MGEKDKKREEWGKRDRDRDERERETGVGEREKDIKRDRGGTCREIKAGWKREKVRTRDRGGREKYRRDRNGRKRGSHRKERRG